MQQISLTGTFNPRYQRILDYSIFLTIFVIGLIHTNNILDLIDIRLYDESTYLNGGLLIPNILPRAEYAPLYSLWYYVISFLQTDSVKLYFLNFKLMTILPPLVLFAAVRAYGVSRMISLILALGFLFSTANFPTWPKVSHFAVLAILIGFFLSSFVKDRKLQTAILVITSFLASYIRPEFFLTFVSLSLILVICTILELRRARPIQVLIPLLATLLPCIFVIYWYAVPAGSGNRSLMAFGQHYSLHWVKWHDDSRNPWTNWEAILNKDFGKLDSPIDALSANPSAFIRHVSQNLKDTPRALEIFLTTHPRSGRARNVLILVLAITVMAGFIRIRRKSWAAIRQRIRDNGAFLWFRLTLLLFAILPGIISIALISPRRHYVFIIGALLIWGLAVLFFRNTEENKKHSSYLIIVLCIAVMLIIRPMSYAIHPHTNLKTIEFIRDLNISVPVNILEAEGGFGIYAGRNYNRIAEYSKREPFSDFMAKKSVNMIVITPKLSNDLRFRDDPEWQSFINEPTSFGFTLMPIPEVEERSLLVKTDFLE